MKLGFGILSIIAGVVWHASLVLCWCRIAGLKCNLRPLRIYWDKNNDEKESVVELVRKGKLEKLKNHLKKRNVNKEIHVGMVPLAVAACHGTC